MGNGPYGPLSRYVKLRVAHALGMPGKFSYATTGKRSRHASRHVRDRDARVVMHAGIANLRLPVKTVAGKMFPAFPAHTQPAILRIW